MRYYAVLNDWHIVEQVNYMSTYFKSSIMDKEMSPHTNGLNSFKN